jgi:hypothetical protein
VLTIGAIFRRYASEDELIFLDIGLYELRKMTIISDIEHITVNSNFN